MKFIKCWYNHKLPGQPWNLAISMALAGYTPEERRKVQVVCRPEIMLKNLKLTQKKD